MSDGAGAGAGSPSTPLGTGGAGVSEAGSSGAGVSPAGVAVEFEIVSVVFEEVAVILVVSVVSDVSDVFVVLVVLVVFDVSVVLDVFDVSPCGEPAVPAGAFCEGWVESTGIELNVFAFFTASAIQLNETSAEAGLLRRIVNPFVFLFATR